MPGRDPTRAAARPREADAPAVPIHPLMSVEGGSILWLLLGFLAFLLVTCALKVLASQRYYAVEMHDRIRLSKQMRQRYLDAVQQKQSKGY